MEKLHGTSAHVGYRAPGVGAPEERLFFFPGGEKLDAFRACFDEAALLEAFRALGYSSATVYGEAYGGRCQGMKATYGDKLRFACFDIDVGEGWLCVPHAAQVASKLGLEFVHWELGPATQAWLDAQRDAPSVQAKRNGCGDGKQREGIVVRPPVEMFAAGGERVIAKYKALAFEETRGGRTAANPGKGEAILAGRAVADEWVTDMRLTHVLDKLMAARAEGEKDRGWDLPDIPSVIAAMIGDVTVEGAGQVEMGHEARKAVGTATVRLFKRRLEQTSEQSEQA